MSATTPQPPTDSNSNAVNGEPKETISELIDAVMAAGQEVATLVVNAFVDGDPEPLLEVIHNTMKAWDAVRTAEPVVALQERNKAAREQAIEDAWAQAERELGFIERALAAKVSEDGAFALLERSFPPTPDEPEPDVLTRLLPHLASALPGCFGQKQPPLSLEEAAAQLPHFGKAPCAPCAEMRAAAEQFHRATNAQAEAATAEAVTAARTELDPLAEMSSYRPVSEAPFGGPPFPPPPFPVGYPQPAHVYGATVTPSGHSTVSPLSSLASLASAYGAPTVPVANHELLSQLGVHAGLKVTETGPERPLDLRVSLDRGPQGRPRWPIPPFSIEGQLAFLVSIGLLVPKVVDHALHFELPPEASGLIPQYMEQADQAVKLARMQQAQERIGNVTSIAEDRLEADRLEAEINGH